MLLPHLVLEVEVGLPASGGLKVGRSGSVESRNLGCGYQDGEEHWLSRRKQPMSMTEAPRDPAGGGPLGTRGDSQFPEARESEAYSRILDGLLA